jgi:chemotaxis-related protein WspD
MTSATELPPLGNDCWNRIGISGDRSCPELVKHIHCRNCPVYESAAKAFFDRSAPEGYLEEWARQLSAPVSASDGKALSVLVFRLEDEWLALRTQVVVEVTSTRPVHVIPHRSGGVLVGMVNLRGQLQLLISLTRMLAIDAARPRPAERDTDQPAEITAGTRLVVFRTEGQTWVFQADDVVGVRRFARSTLTAVPSTLANADCSFSQAVIPWRDQSIGLLDDQRIAAALRGIGQ